jgi:hypothetical protein
MTTMRNWLSPMLLTVLVACDAGTDVDTIPASYILTHVDGMDVPAELSRTFTVTSTTTARVVEGWLRLTTDSARLALLTESRTVDTNGQEVASELYCTYPMLGYRRTADRIFLDLEIAAGPPSQGFPSGAISIHDTLFIDGDRLSGRHTLSPAPQVLANRRVLLQFEAGPFMMQQCP